jgi:hypothetical protein
MGTPRDHGRTPRGSNLSAHSQRRKEPEADPAGEKAADEKSAGRVVFDSRGNSVWRWENEQDESTSILLKRLENDDLALEPTRPVPILGKRNVDGKPSKKGHEADRKLAIQDKQQGGGFDPYNRS